MTNQEKKKRVLREIYLWTLFFSYAFLCVLAGIHLYASGEFPLFWTVLLFFALLLLGMLLFFLFLLTRLTPRTGRFETFPLTLLPNTFWKTSHYIVVLLLLFFIRTIILY